MHGNAQDLLHRAHAVLAGAHFGKIGPATRREYGRLSRRIIAERTAAGADWAGPISETQSRSSNAVRRAAWTRRAHHEVAVALQDLTERRRPPEMVLEHLATWVPEAERTPTLPRPDIRATRGRTSGARSSSSSLPSRRRSKKATLRELPPDWMTRIWRMAVTRQCRHLDALAVLLVTGGRPIEVARGVVVDRHAGGIEIALVTAKRRAGAKLGGRCLAVAGNDGGPADHLRRLLDATAGTRVRVRGQSAAGLSMMVTRLGATCDLPHRISAYDIRHQRCADARLEFGGDVERVAAWLGHSTTDTSQHYGRLTNGGCRGPKPVEVTTSMPIRYRSHVVEMSLSPGTRAI